MAITIDRLTRIISVPKADMTLVQSTPIEIRELDISSFHFILRDIEDDEAGIVIPTTHNYSAPVSVGGVTLALVFELINGYTVTFENGSYAVNLAGGNSNIADKTNFNLVSVRSTNSAGLVQSREIEDAAYGGKVYVDTVGGTGGTLYPTGTAQQPCNSIENAIIIAELRGFKTIHFFSNATATSAHDLDGYNLESYNPHASTLTIASGAMVDMCNFIGLRITGDLSAAGGTFTDCILDDLTMFNGNAFKCHLDGTIYIVGSTDVVFHDCDASCPNGVIIDCGGSGRNIEFRNFNGGLEFQNKTGPEDLVVLMNSGCLTFANTVTSGTIDATGVSRIISDQSTATKQFEGLVNHEKFNAELFAKEIEANVEFAQALRLYNSALYAKVSGAGSNTITFRDIADSKDRIVSTTDEDGNRTSVTIDGT